MTVLPPGEATRRYLRALRERTMQPIDWSAAPPAHKRYPDAIRTVLPWTAPSMTAVGSGLIPLGTLLRGLQGPCTSWVHRATLTQNRTGARPTVGLRRPTPSGGALYPIETYLCTGPSAEPDPGLYHYDQTHHGLELVRSGDHRGAVIGQLAAPPAARPDLFLVFTAVFWRSGFKYRDFAYRLCCQETGALTAQALALAEHLGLTAGVHLAFADQHINALLGLEPDAEATLAILGLRRRHTPDDPAGPTLAELTARPASEPTPPAPPVTRSLPLLAALHSASGRHQPPTNHTPIAASRTRTRTRARTERPNGRVRLPARHGIRLVEGIAERASTQHGFAATQLQPDSVADVLASATIGYPGDLPGAQLGPASITMYLVARKSGITPGAYRYEATSHTLIRVGNAVTVRGSEPTLQPNTRVALPEAAAILLPVGDPLQGIPSFGDRWYRMQQIEAGLVVHRATLAATALGMATRIHSDGTNATTNATLGLGGTSLESLSFLLLGGPRPGATLHPHPRR